MSSLNGQITVIFGCHRLTKSNIADATEYTEINVQLCQGHISIIKPREASP